MDIQPIVDLIRNENDFLITSHIDPDGDNIASQLALLSIFKELGKRATIVDRDPVPASYQFLLEGDVCHQHSPENAIFQYAFVVDAASLERIGEEIASLVLKTKGIVNLDHHVSNTMFGMYNWVDHTASSATMVIYDLAKALDIKFTPQIAMRMYSGLVTDTGRFRFSNTGLKTFEVAADLVRLGANPFHVSFQIYDQKPLSAMRLLVRVLSSLSEVAEGKIRWMEITNDCYQKANAKPQDGENIIEYATSIKGTKIAMLFREMNDSNKIRVSLRSNGNIDVNKLAHKFGGGGHPSAAGCRVEGTLEDVRQKVIDEALKWV